PSPLGLLVRAFVACAIGPPLACIVEAILPVAGSARTDAVGCARMPANMRPWARALSKFAASRPGSWFYLNVANPIDRRLLPATGGRLSVSVGQPVLCLEVRGAKTGRIRRTPLLFAELDGNLVVLASATG